MMKLLRNTCWAPIAAALILCPVTRAHASCAVQETQQYTMEEYKAFQAAGSETDPAKKTALIMQFLEERPKSALRPNMIGMYQQFMNELQAEKRWGDLIRSGTQFLKVEPEDIYTHSLLTTAYQETKNNAEFVSHAAKVYAKNPNGTLAYYMAKAYLEMKNEAQYLEWGEKTVEFMPDNFETLLEVSKRFAALNQRAKASKYAKLCIKALQGAKKPDAMDEKAWRDYNTAAMATTYGIIGNIAYEQREYASAIANLENSVKYYRRNSLAYYYLGLSYWQTNKLDIAMLNLAKAYLLGGPSASAAKQHLDNLYKTTHQQSLVGQDRVINRAKLDLKGP